MQKDEKERINSSCLEQTKFEHYNDHVEPRRHRDSNLQLEFVGDD